MYGMLRSVIVSALLITLSACNHEVPTTEHQMTMARIEKSKAEFGTYFTDMVDNAIARDMSVADVHFVPHTTEINGIGEVRLTRMAELLKTYGGTVRYESYRADPTLINKRIAHVREYLKMAGCDMDRVTVAAMISGGRGLPGEEAVEKIRKGTAEDEQTASQPASFTGGLGSGSGNQ